VRHTSDESKRFGEQEQFFVENLVFGVRANAGIAALERLAVRGIETVKKISPDVVLYILH
jgi:hypothetical protein